MKMCLKFFNQHFKTKRQMQGWYSNSFDGLGTHCVYRKQSNQNSYEYIYTYLKTKKKNYIGTNKKRDWYPTSLKHEVKTVLKWIKAKWLKKISYWERFGVGIGKPVCWRTKLTLASFQDLPVLFSKPLRLELGSNNTYICEWSKWVS